MDHAIKAALDKYHGKTPRPPSGERSNRTATVIITLIVLICVFALFVKNGWLHTDKLWEKISSFSIGSKTVGQILRPDTSGSQTEAAQETQQATSPVNPTGQSGSVEPTQTLFFSGAGYLDGIRDGLSFVTPVAGTVTCGYGWRIHPLSGKDSFHSGVDIGAAEGTPVRAYRTGVVDQTGYSETYGNFILLTHGTIQSFYAHLSRVDVNKGETVRCGQTLGAVGSTGVSTGPHLHFEIRKDGESTDPLRYITITP